MSGSDIVRIGREVSPEAAEQLMRAFAGTTIYIPSDPRPEQPISLAVGHENAVAIARTLGAGRMEVPTGARAAEEEKAARIVALLREGRSQTEIARAVGCSTRTVGRWARRLRQEEP